MSSAEMPPSEGSRVTEIPGDLFDAPDGSALIHACNCQGAWGAGIAEAFKEKLPTAYDLYRHHCRASKRDNRTHEITDLQSEEERTITVKDPLGTAVIFPPLPPDFRGGKKKHYIVCLFTSDGYGRHVSSPDMIVNSTHAALKDLKEQLDRYYQTHRTSGEPKKMGKLYCCRFNSGLFGVPWEWTRKLLDDSGLDVTVVYPPGEDEKGKKQ